MSLEDNIAALTKAIEANTAALKAGGGKPAAGGATPAAAAGYKAKYDLEKAQAVLGKVKETIGIEKAREIMKANGGFAKMAEITGAKNIDAIYEAGTKALEEAEAAAGGSDDM